MDLGVEAGCQFTGRPTGRTWIPDDPEHIDAPEEGDLECSRSTVDGCDYCAFHLSPAEQEARDIDTGERLRQTLATVADESSTTAPSEANVDFRGAYLTEVDLSGLDFGEMSGFTIDLRYASIAGTVNLSELRFAGTVDCRFVRCDSLVIRSGEFGRLTCTGSTLQNQSDTTKGSVDRAFSIRRDAEFERLDCAGADIAGDVFVNAVDVASELNLEGVTVEGRLHLSAEADTCDVSDGVISDEFIIEGSDFSRLDCSSVTAATVEMDHLNVEDSGDSADGIQCSELSADRLGFHRVSAERVEAISPEVTTVHWNRVTVAGPVSLHREEGIAPTIERLRMTECSFGGKAKFDRLEPSSAEFDLRAGELVEFRKFCCQDATFDPDSHPMFRGDVDFTGAELQGATLRNFEASGQVTFTNADLTDARLLNANLEDAVLEGTLLSRARLVGAKLNRAYLYHASLSDASIDISTEFGDRVVYDPESSDAYDPNLGLNIPDPGTAGASPDEPSRESRTDGGTPANPGGAGQQATQGVPQAQKAKEVYQSIHNAARQSGDSGEAIAMYIKRQEMESELLKQGHRSSDGLLPDGLVLVGRRVYAGLAQYGVGTQRLLGFSLAWVGLACVLLAVRDGASAVYGIGGFVGATPGLDATFLIQLLIGVEALVGAFLVALFVNALGRRSSM